MGLVGGAPSLLQTVVTGGGAAASGAGGAAGTVVVPGTAVDTARAAIMAMTSMITAVLARGVTKALVIGSSHIL